MMGIYLYIVVMGIGFMVAPIVSMLVASSLFNLPAARSYGASLLGFAGFVFAFAMSTGTRTSPVVFWLATVPLCYALFTLLAFVIVFTDKTDKDETPIAPPRLAKATLVSTGILVAINPYSYLAFAPVL